MELFVAFHHDVASLNRGGNDASQVTDIETQ